VESGWRRRRREGRKGWWQRYYCECEESGQYWVGCLQRVQRRRRGV